MLDHIFSQRFYDLYRIEGALAYTKKTNARYTFKALNAQDFKNCPLAQEKNRLKDFHTRLSSGHHCFGHFDQEAQQIISYFWITKGSEKNLAPFDFGRSLIVPPNEIYIWDCRIASAHAGQGLYQNGLSKILEDHQHNKIWILSQTTNKASCYAIEKIGFQKQARFQLIRLFKSILLCRNTRILPAPHKIALADFLPAENAEK